VLKTGRRVQSSQMAAIASELHTPVKMLRAWLLKALHGSLRRKPGSGRPRKAFASEIYNWLCHRIRDVNGAITIRQLVADMRNDLGWGCAGSVHKLLRRFGFRHARQRLVPLLSPAHMTRRLEWANALLTRPQEVRFGGDNEVLVHCDEKWFFGTHVTHIWQSATFRARPIPVLSKTHLLKEMFLAAVARPIPARNFDGAIGIWAVTETKVAKHTSKYHKKGEQYETSCTMDVEKFIEMVTTKMVPAVLAECRKWATKITIQMDNAGAHGGGHGDITKTTIQKLTEWVSDFPQHLLEICDGRHPEIIFVALPPRSPDLNVLDLGAWHSLQAAVDIFKHTKKLCPDNVDQLRTLVYDTWAEWIANNPLPDLFVTLNRVLELIRSVNGGINYNPNDLHHNR